jgi:hypothetical protein
VNGGWLDSCRACKPNSVCRSFSRGSQARIRRQRAARRSFLWAAHYCAALATYPEVVTRRASTRARRRSPQFAQKRRESGTPKDAPPLFGLAPCGVFPATAIAGGAVRSYRTFSPLPRLRGAVCFLWHFPSTPLERRRPDVIRHTALWSSDFPLPACATWPGRSPRDAERPVFTSRQRPSGPAANSVIIDGGSSSFVTTSKLGVACPCPSGL